MEMLERKPLEKLVKKKQLIAFKHKGFWHCMDTLRDKLFLEDLIRIRKKVPWKI
jgi:glucose-1-phosphate cytidylyltransferase